MRQNNKILLWIIVILTVISVLIDLPKNLRIKFTLANFSFDRILSSPAINFSIGNFSIRKNFDTRLGLDLSGGTHLVMEADMTNIQDTDREKAFVSSKNIVEQRINLFGLTEPVVQQAKLANSYRIIVEIPGISDVNRAVDLIGTTAQLDFREEATASGQATPSSIMEMWPLFTGLTGKNLKQSQVTFDPNTGKPQVALEFDGTGATLFEELTKRNVGKTIAIFLDNQLLSAPRVNEVITGGQAVIQGAFTANEAKQLSIMLNAGALPVPLKVIEQRKIGATLGQESINKSILAGTIGLFIVAVFMIVNYGFRGVVADIALVIYSLITLAVFKTVPVTLTLAGIAGFILSIGMAVDANILIFERMKEELRWGRDHNIALKLGFDRAFPSIRDSNISSLITCGILYWFGTGIVRGFAITLAIGILVSLFSSITVTRTFLKMIYQ